MSAKYLSLADAARMSPYTQEYLSLRARQGKLQALKLGRNWVTTEDWLNNYLEQVRQSEAELKQVRRYDDEDRQLEPAPAIDDASWLEHHTERLPFNRGGWGESSFLDIDTTLKSANLSNSTRQPATPVQHSPAQPLSQLAKFEFDVDEAATALEPSDESGIVGLPALNQKSKAVVGTVLALGLVALMFGFGLASSPLEDSNRLSWSGEVSSVQADELAPSPGYDSLTSPIADQPQPLSWQLISARVSRGFVETGRAVYLAVQPN